MTEEEKAAKAKEEAEKKAAAEAKAKEEAEKKAAAEAKAKADEAETARKKEVLRLARRAARREIRHAKESADERWLRRAKKHKEKTRSESSFGWGFLLAPVIVIAGAVFFLFRGVKNG